MKAILSIFLFLTIINAQQKDQIQEHKYTNSLISSDSAYLKQHAHNPIDWYAWDEKSLAKAKKEDKLIFLSIGYSTCHWCHVMEKESFENEELAKLFNKHYISIKVDREIHSDLDVHYQSMLSSFKDRRNGWPLSAILTPDLRVLHITTYIPPKFDYGVEGLDTLLLKYAKLFENKVELSKQLIKNKKMIESYKNYKPVSISDVQKSYVDYMKSIYDDEFKGFYKRPRFPYAANLSLLYDIYDLSGNQDAKKMLYEPLIAMAKGGIYDQVEGGFFRYSVHPDWMIPHFEKMLYTNAELVPIYTRAYLDTNNELFKKVVVQTLEEMNNRFKKDDVFYSASDADSNGKEGEYFTFKYDEVYKALQDNGYSDNEIDQNLEYLDVSSVGNFEDDASNPHYNNNFKEDIKPEKLGQTLGILKMLRGEKEYPFIDKKVITSWNAMMIKAYLEASKIDVRYKLEALDSIDSLLKKVYVNGKLYQHFNFGKELTKEAILEDYAFLIDTLLYAYSLDYESRYLDIAIELSKVAMEKFYIDEKWYLSNSSLNVEANFIDRYYTSAVSKMFENLITISGYNYDIGLLYKVKTMLKNYNNQIFSDIGNHSWAIRSIIRLNKGDIIIKSNKTKLRIYKDKINEIKYPFLYTKMERERDFLVCDSSSCFGYSDEFEGLITMILDRINK